jgi:hypothetical protein
MSLLLFAANLQARQSRLAEKTVALVVTILLDELSSVNPLLDNLSPFVAHPDVSAVAAGAVLSAGGAHGWAHWLESGLAAARARRTPRGEASAQNIYPEIYLSSVPGYIASVDWG